MKVEAVDNILERSLHYMGLDEALAEQKSGTLFMDTRDVKIFEQGFIPGSMSISLATNFASITGSILPPHTKFIIVASQGKEGESIIRLTRIGFDNIVGVLDGGFEVYEAAGLPVDKLNHIAPEDLTSDKYIVDVRNPGEFAAGSVKGSINVPLSQIADLFSKDDKTLKEKIPEEGAVYITCQSG